MSKMTKIPKCIDCLNCEVHFGWRGLHHFLEVYCRKTYKYVGKYWEAEFIKTPGWCPLEDAEEEEVAEKKETTKLEKESEGGNEGFDL